MNTTYKSGDNINILNADYGVLALYKLIKHGCPEGQTVIVIGRNMSVFDLKEMRELIKEVIENNQHLYLALKEGMEVDVFYIEK